MRLLTARGDWSRSSSSPGLHMTTRGIITVPTSVSHTEHTKRSHKEAGRSGSEDGQHERIINMSNL